MKTEDVNVNELISKVESLLDENHELEKTVMRLETERNTAQDKARNNRHDAEAWFSVGFGAVCIVGIITFFIGCFCSRNHYFWAPEMQPYAIGGNYMEVKHIEEYYTGDDKKRYSKYDVGDNIIVIDTVGKYTIGDVLCTGKVIFTTSGKSTPAKNEVQQLPDTTKTK